MKKSLSCRYLSIIAAVVVSVVSSSAYAQYTSIVNQAANMLQTAVIGGFSYKGYVDASFTGGFGNLKANFAGLSTVQGFQYADWFFMGAGLGVDLVFSNVDDYDGYIHGHDTHSCGVMIPVFSDFRFNIGSRQSASFFIDIKAGGSFLVGGDYLAVQNGYISSSEYFMLKPSLGVRIPVGKGGKQAFNLGITYQLLTCNYWYDDWYNNTGSGTLNSLGGTVSFEW
ncbi:MAG: hypothetical protein J5995_07615 [Muribaculaceae bacterium]|nr:hypothetical protein [Muribaculaceae bacterium]